MKECMSATFDFSWRTYQAPYNIIEFINDTFYKLVEGLSSKYDVSKYKLCQNKGCSTCFQTKETIW